MMKLVSVYCSVLGIVCPEQIVLVRLLNMQYFGLNPDPVCSQRSDPVQIGPDLQHCTHASNNLVYGSIRMKIIFVSPPSRIQILTEKEPGICAKFF
jgi:hypothetical protein